MIGCSLTIGLSDIDIQVADQISKPDLNVVTWVPVLFSLATPIFFVVGTLFTKYLTSPKIGFEPFTLSFGYTGLTNLLTLLVGIIWFWSADNPVN